MCARAGWPIMSWWWASPVLRWATLALLLAFYAVLSLEPFDWRIPPRLANGAQFLADGPFADRPLADGVPTGAGDDLSGVLAGEPAASQPAASQPAEAPSTPGRAAQVHAAEGQEAQGWRFATPGIVVAQAPHDWLDAAIEAETLAVSLKVRPFLTNQSGPARILTLSSDAYSRNLTLAQEDADLVVRLRSQATNANALRDRRPIARIADVFRAGRWVAIDLRIEPGLLSIAIDGAPALATPLPPAVLGTWEPAFDLALGNELTCNRPWLGEIREAVVAGPDGAPDAAANYADAWLVEVPDSCLVTLHPPTLVPFQRFLLDDALRNIVMYLPLGCLLGLMARVRDRHRFGALVLAIAGVSLAFECAQLFLDSRFPSVDDLIFNTLGGTLGLALAFWLARHLDQARRSAA